MTGLKVVVNHRDGFIYGKQAADERYPDVLRDGQIALLKGLPNDAKLMEIGYFRRWDKDVDEEIRCDCGRDFASDVARMKHLPEHHPDVSAPVDHIIDEAYTEEQVLKESGIGNRNITQAGARRGQREIQVSKQYCPMGCGHQYASKDIRAHVVACQAGGVRQVANKPVTRATKVAAKASKATKPAAKPATKRARASKAVA